MCEIILQYKRAGTWLTNGRRSVRLLVLLLLLLSWFDRFFFFFYVCCQCFPLWPRSGYIHFIFSFASDCLLDGVCGCFFCSLV